MTGPATARPSIPAERFAERLERAAAATAKAGLDALLIGVGSDLRYLTGYEAMPLERLTMLSLTAGAPPFIVVPRLERGAAEAGLRTPIEIRTWEETEDPYALVAAAIDASPERAVRIGLSDTMIALHVLRLQASFAPAATFESASPVLRELRMIKDADEIALLRRAAQAADRVVGQIAAGRLVGRTEADVAREVRERLIAEGHDEAHFAIVGSGPNSASPHHEASERVIRAGEPIVLDIGGTLGGYGSDITRTLWVTGGDPAAGPDERFRHLFAVLYSAQAAATRAVRPGVACEAIDAAARDPIERRGLRRGVLPPDRARDRPRGPRGPVPRRRQRPAAPDRDGLQRRARDLSAGRVRRAHRGHRRLRRRTARSCSTRRRASCTSSTADPGRHRWAPAVSSRTVPYPSGLPSTRDPMPTIQRRRPVAEPLVRDTHPGRAA